MINLNIYVTEKLRVNKNTKLPSNPSDLNKVEDIIIDYLKEHTYFGCNRNDFEIVKKQDTGNEKLYVFLKYKNKHFEKWHKLVGKQITDIIKKKLGNNWYWNLNYIDAIIFSDTYNGGEL